MLSAADWARSRWAIARGTVLGFFIGILPGAGSTIASFLAYTMEKKVSRHPEEFGRGAIEGVAAPESANNAASAGAMVPMLTLGHPRLGHHRHHAGRLHDVGAPAGAPALREEPRLRVGADRLHVHRQRRCW